MQRGLLGAARRPRGPSATRVSWAVIQLLLAKARMQGKIKVVRRNRAWNSAEALANCVHRSHAELFRPDGTLRAGLSGTADERGQSRGIRVEIELLLNSCARELGHSKKLGAGVEDSPQRAVEIIHIAWADEAPGGAFDD